MPTTLTPRDLSSVRETLSTSLAHVRARLRRLESPSPDAYGGESNIDADSAQGLEQREATFVDRERLILTARGLVAALARVRDGSYGICASCQQAIPEARMRAVPTAELCRPCLEGLESHAARNRRGRGWTAELEEEVEDAAGEEQGGEEWN